jgi:hypothetical protein
MNSPNQWREVRGKVKFSIFLRPVQSLKKLGEKVKIKSNMESVSQ